MKFKFILRNLRFEEKISQEALATSLGVTRGAVAQWENGFTIPTNDMLTKIADYFNVSLDYLMGRSDIKNPNNINITQDDFSIAFSNLQGDLTEEDKRQILKMAQFLAEENKNNKK